MPYLQQPAPERLPMSAGKSLLVQGQGVNDLDGALLILDGMLVKRLNETL